MPFYGAEPFDKAEAYYVWAGLKSPGFFRVTVSGHAPKYSSGFKLVRDPHWAGGLAIDVMGWTGPLASPPATTPYKVTETFPGAYHAEIVVIGANKREVVHVREVPFKSDEEVMKELSAA